jgi:hypothetical protein
MASLRNIAVSLLHIAGVTEILRTLQAICRDRNRILDYLPLRDADNIKSADDFADPVGDTTPPCGHPLSVSWYSQSSRYPALSM